MIQYKTVTINQNYARNFCGSTPDCGKQLLTIMMMSFINDYLGKNSCCLSAGP